MISLKQLYNSVDNTLESMDVDDVIEYLTDKNISLCSVCERSCYNNSYNTTTECDDFMPNYSEVYEEAYNLMVDEGIGFMEDNYED